MRIVNLRHVPFEGLGTIAAWARDRGHTLVEHRVFEDDCFPASDEYDWLVVMGGPMNVYQDGDHPWLARERGFARKAIEDGKLVLGVCLGAQMLADALGGRVYKNAQPEIGWFPVTLAAEAAVSRTFRDLPAVFTALHWHGDTFDIPNGATLLAMSDATPNQAFEANGGKVVAMQFHLEATPKSVAALIGACGDELLELPCIQTAAELASGAQQHAAAMRPLLEDILSRMERLGPA